METPEQYTVGLPEKIYPVNYGGFWDFSLDGCYDASPLNEMDFPNAEQIANEVSRRYNEFNALKEENERLNHEAEKWKAASDQHYENWSNGVSKIAELIKENERLKGTIGAEAVRQNLELKQENAELNKLLSEAYEFVNKYQSLTGRGTDMLYRIQDQLSKHQPIKKDEN